MPVYRVELVLRETAVTAAPNARAITMDMVKIASITVRMSNIRAAP
jgi:hypothetical protein